MRTAIFQYWAGGIPAYAQSSRKMFEKYSRRIGSEYFFDHNGKYLRVPNYAYYGSLRPVFDPFFDQFDKILTVDMDVFPVDGLEDDIFDVDVADFGMSEESEQPVARERMTGKIRSENDKRWASVAERFWSCNIPKDKAGRPLVFNSGVVLYTREGIQNIRKRAPKITFYQAIMIIKGVPRFYRLDQNYLGVIVGLSGVRFSKIADNWNSSVNIIGTGNGNTRLLNEVNTMSNFIHFQHSIKKSLSENDCRNIARRELELINI